MGHLALPTTSQTMEDIAVLHPKVIDRFKNILATAKAIENCCAPLKSQPPPINSLPLSINLPPPNDITEDLMKMGLSLSSTKHLSGYFMQKCLELKRSVEDKIQKYITTVRLAQFPPSVELQRKTSSVFEQLYSKLLSNWTTQTLNMVHARQVGVQKHCHKTRRPFNPVSNRYV
jgi:hypothetical protein